MSIYGREINSFQYSNFCTCFAFFSKSWKMVLGTLLHWPLHLRFLFIFFLFIYFILFIFIFFFFSLFSFFSKHFRFTIKPLKVPAKIIFTSRQINLKTQNLTIIPYNQEKCKLNMLRYFCSSIWLSGRWLGHFQGLPTLTTESVHVHVRPKPDDSSCWICNLLNSVTLCTRPVSWCTNYMSQVIRKWVLCHMRTTNAQISLRIRAVWSAPLLFAAKKE